MILFFGDVLDHKNDVETHLSVDYKQLDCENFKKMFALWRQSKSGSDSILADNELVGCQRQDWKGFDTLPLYEETIRRAKGTYPGCEHRYLSIHH